MPYAMQCIKFNSPTQYKGGYKRKSYAPSKERINPYVVNVYEPNAQGVLVLQKIVRPKSK